MVARPSTGIAMFVVAFVAAACHSPSSGGGTGGGPGAVTGGSNGAAGTMGLRGGPAGASGSASGGTIGQGGTTGSGGQPAVGGAGGSGGLACAAPTPSGPSYTVDSSGVTLTLNPGQLRMQVCEADIIRIEYSTASSIPAKMSSSVSASWGTPGFCVTESAGVLTVTTARLKVKVSESNGLVTFSDLSDNVLVAEANKSLTTAAVEASPHIL